MHQIKIDVVGLQTLELLVQKTIKIRWFLYQPAGGFGGQKNFVPIAVLERTAYQRFAGAAFAHSLTVVGIGGVDVIDALIDGLADQADGLSFVDLAVCAGHKGQTHAAKAQDGYHLFCFAETSILHKNDLLY